MTEVWILEVGEYSDRYVHSVYSTEEQADEASQLLQRTFANPIISISSFPLDQKLPTLPTDRRPFWVVIDNRGTHVGRPSGYFVNFDELAECENQTIKVWKKEGKLDSWQISLMAKDDHHAVKIAGEKYAQWQATEAALV